MICADFVFLGPCCVGLYHLCRLVDAPVLLCTPLELFKASVLLL